MPISNADHWRDRARTTHIKADEAKDARTKRMLRGMAEAYERLAKQMHRRARAKKPK